MPVFNAAAYLPEAVESILRQTFTDFELLILDDCSTDGSLEIIRDYEIKDSRIRVLENPKNCGESYCRNRHFKEARGKYFALMDADDVSNKERLRIQNRFLDENPDIGIVGTWAMRFSEDGRKKRLRYPTRDWDIKSYLLKGSPICNPSVMMRAETIRQCALSYNLNYRSAMDYLFWVDACKSIRMANIPIPLFHYRVHSNQNTAVYKRVCESNHVKIMSKHLAHFRIEADTNTIRRFLWPRAFPCVSATEVLQIGKMIASILAIKNFYGYKGVSQSARKHIRRKYIRVWRYFIMRLILGRLT